MKTIRIFIFFCWLGSLNTFGQEICNNDIDDDGDGFIDCFDTDCANNSFCDGTFLGNDVSCQAQPTQFPTFSMSLDWDSADKTAVHFGRLAIGDLDNDGVPEVVSFNTYDDRIYILDGSDGSTKFVEDVGPDYRRRFDHDIAIANLNNDNCGEIFVMGKNDDDDGYTLASYDCQLNELWIVDAGSKNIGALGLADFDGDGSVELYYKDEIRNAATGAIIVASTTDFDDLADGGVAVDIAGDTDLELVVGGTIFDVNLGAGTATSINTMPGYNVKGRFPSTSVADYNLDGNLDVIATGADASDVTTIFFWDVTTNIVLTYSDAFGTGDYEFGWKNGAGRVNIADIDGDANLDITYVSGEYLYALDENMNQLWRSQINEQSSGYTGCTLFDFNGDGVSEVVYRDEEWLYIINGVDGSLYPGGSVACISRTFIEYPIVADVDADGATELCVTCGQDDALAWANFWTNSYSQNSHVRVFESAGEPWVPARRLWNQHGYFNVNVNDDMTIPPIQQKHHLAFSTGTCTTGPNRPLNSFLNQSPYLDSNGCPVYASPDLAFVNNSLSVQVPTCPDQNFQVSFQVENLGDIDLSGNLPITFYEGDPTQPTANRLNTETVAVTSLVPGGILDVNNLPVNGNGGNFVLYIVLNDDGTTIPLNLPNTDFFECDYSNNILSEDINPLPFSLTAEASDNTVCDITLPGTGSARAYRLVAMVEETADYTFNWYDGTTVSGAPDFTGPVYSNLSDGDYTVFALHNTAGCSSDTVTVTVNLTPQSITAAIILQNQYTSCNNPNGHLLAEVNGGDPVGWFTYEWYQGDNIFTSPLIGTSHSITGLAPGQYTLLVTEKATGCQTIETYTIIDDSVPPVVNASATDASCPNPTSGTVTANVNGGNGGHSFAWYIGNSVKPTADFTTNTVNNLAPGDYTVVATKNSDQCSSAPITVTVSIPSDPVVSVSLVAEQTSCDPLNPNGAASANVGGVTAGYTFVWYEGQGTAGLVVSNSANATGLSTGPHTVEVTDNATGCSATEEIDITQTLTYPTVTANVDAHQTDCAPADGQLSASVGGTTAGYTFYWFDGNIGTPDLNNPDATGTTYSGLVAGDYTVVAVDNNTSCPSSRVVAQVADNTVLPAINISVTDQTSCDPLTPNGELSADIGGVTAGFTFTWYQGAGTGGAVISNVATATSLAAGVYTVEAVNNTTGCVNTAQRTLNNNFVYPTVTAVLDSDQTICDPLIGYDGQVSANVGGATAGFTFLWYDGNVGTPDLNNPDFTGAVYSGLTAGTYTVVALGVATSCPSNIATVSVANNTVAPTITTNVTDQTSCDLGNPNGQLSANVGGVTAGFTFTWYQGAGTGGAVISNVATATSLAAGVYTVEVVNDATGCTNTSQTTLNNNLTYPTASTNVDAHQTDCTPPNGQVSASVGGTTAGYTFYWFDGNIGTPDINNPDATGVTYSGLVAGDYTVVAVDNNTLCPSSPVVAQVLDNTVIPAINVNVTDQTSCDPLAPNGELSADIGGVTAGFTFTWYQGAGTGGAVISNVATATGLIAGVYTVEVVNNATGCSNTSQTTLNNNFTYPTVAAIVDANQTICDPLIGYDGQVSANVGGVTAGFTFLWYDGTVGTPDVNNPDFTGPTYSGLTAGTYTVLALGVATSCPSNPLTVTVADNTVAPAITTNVTDQTSCDPLAPNGQLSANIGGVTAGYTFTWHQGAGTGGAVISNVATATSLAAGVYTVEVVNDATGCSNTEQTTLNNNFTYPTVTPVVDANQTFCNPVNGELSAHVGGVTAGYTFYWFNGNVGTPDITMADATGIQYDGLAAGDYTVVAVDNNTLCPSSPVVVQVANNTVLPAININITEQTSCDLTSPNGQLSADIGGVTAGFTFTWYQGAGTGGAVISNVASATSLPAGVYTVQAVNNTTGCTNTAQTTLNNNLTYPSVATIVDSDQTICDPLIGYDGQVSANVGGITAGFTFLWYDGNVGTPDINNPDFTGPTYSGLIAGTYTVVALGVVTNCPSSPLTVDVADNTVTPAINTNVTAQTSCDLGNPNGQLSADVGGVTAGFTFTWYQGAGTGGAVVSNVATATSLAAGVYTVEVVNDATGCSNTEQTTLNNNFTYPTVTPVVDANQTFCNPVNGELSAHVGGVTAGYTFYWFNGNVGTPDITMADATGIQYDGLAAGDYTVVAVDNNTLCPSSPVVVQVADNTVLPNVVAAKTDNTACDPLLYNGTISAGVGAVGAIAGYTFHIFSGQSTAPANELPGSPSDNLNGLTAGIYTVQAIDNTTGCANTTEVTVANNIVQPTLSVLGSDVMGCSPLDGSITASVNVGVVGDYTFSWYDGSSVKATPDYLTTGNILSGLDAGTYTVNAYNDVLGCLVQAPQTITINRDPSTVITITELPAELTIPSDCNVAGGQLGVQAASPGNVGGFSFSWYQGDVNTTMVPIGSGTDFPVNSNRLGSLLSGRYTVIAQDNDTGCQDSLAIDLPYAGSPTLLSITIRDNDNCTASNGEFTVQVTPSASALALGADETWFAVQIWKDGVMIDTQPGAFPNNVFVGLQPGDYTVIAVETNPALSGCSTSEDATIGNVAVPPVITTNSILDNRNCTGATGTGVISLTIDGVANPALGYSYNWFQGQTTAAPPLPAGNITAPGHSAINLTGGYYTVEVIDNADPNNTCSSVATFFINDNPLIISINSADINLTHQTDCAPPFLGDATVTDVYIDGISNAGTTGFTFDWFESDGTTLVGGAGTGDSPAVNLAPGDYFVRATNTASNCMSSLVGFEILDNTMPPNVVMVHDAPNTICDILTYTPNGQLSASVTEGVTTGVTAGYTFEWFSGQNNTNPADALPAGNIAGGNGEIAQNLAPGFYTVRVTDIASPNNSCQTVSTMEVQDVPDIVNILTADIAITNQNDCAPPNGSATVNSVIVNGVGQPAAGFSFDWYQSDAATLVAGAGNAATLGVNLAAGTYFVQATSNTSGCASSLVEFEILDVSQVPVVVMVHDAPNTVCDIITHTPNGQLSASVTEGVTTGVTAGYTFEWFSGQNNTNPADALPAGNIAGGNGEIAQNLAPGFYTVRVTDNVNPNNSCQTVSTMEVQDVPDIVNILTADIAITNQNDCAPPNGSATVNSVIVNGVGQPAAGFSFDWYQSDAATLVAGAGNAATVGVNLAAGTYFVQATSNTSGCASSLVEFEILDVSQVPVVVMVHDAPNTICDILTYTPNGQLSASVTEGVTTGVTAGYTFEWFSGQNNTNPADALPAGNIAGGNGEIAQNLAPGFYTVRVTDNVNPNNSCQTISTMEVQDVPDIVNILTADIAITNQNDCAPPNGSATVNSVIVNGVGQPAAGFSFDWYQSDAATLVAGAGNAATLGVNLAAGTYFVQATSNTSGCASSLVEFEILDVSQVPVVVMVHDAPNTVCDIITHTPNGQLSASVTEGVTTGVTAGYTFEWFSGQNNTNPADALPAGNIAGGNGEIAQNLAPGFYTVRVTDNVNPNNSCQTVSTMEVQDVPDIVNILTADIAITNQNDCAPPNGSATVNSVIVNGVGQPAAGFSFDWYQSDAATLVAGAGNAATVGVNLAAGTYFVQATSNTSGCASSLVEFEILDVSQVPVVVMVHDAPNTICDILTYTPNGQLSASVTEGVTTGVTAGYTFEWFSGQNNTNPADALPAGNIAGGNGEIAQNLAPGFYTVRVTDNVNPNNSCQTISTMEVQDVPDIVNILTADIAITNQNDCAPPNGSATVNSVIVNGVGQPAAGFSFDWYQSDAATLVAGAGNAATVGVNLAAGTYFVQATSNTSGCASSLVEFEILDVSQVPVVVMVHDAPNTICDILTYTPNGQLSASVTEGVTTGVTAGYTFEWFSGQNNTNPADALPAGNIAGGNGEIAQNLAPGFYTVRVTDNVNPNNSCQTVSTMEVQDVPDIVNILTADIAITNQNDCAPPNGSATVNSVIVNGVGQPAAGFSFDWYQSDAATLVAGAGNAATVGVNLAAGTYFVQATSNTSGCASSLVEFEILDVSQVPVVVMVHDAPNTVCDIITHTPNGQLSASVTEGVTTGVTAGYTFEWFSGQNNTNPADALPAGNIAGGNGEIAQNLAPGFYTVRVTDNVNPNNSCQTVSTMEVQDIPDMVIIANADLIITNQTDCTPVNGSATINSVLVNGIGQPTGGFNFDWYQSDAITPIAGAGNTATVAVNLTAGTYFVQATDINTGCITALVEFEILDLTALPVITLVSFTNPTQCGQPNVLGELSVTADGSTSIVDYSFTWYQGTDATGILVPGNNPVLNNITTGGDYYLEVTNNSTGCVSSAQYTLQTEIRDIVLSANTTDVTNCISPDGTLFATVTSGGSNNYNYNWYIGNTATGTPDYTGKSVLNVDMGEYTIVAVDQADPTCSSMPITMTVGDGRMYPQVELVQINPVTNCDTSRPNGAAEATASGTDIGYTFEWFVGTSINGMPFYTGSQANGLSAITYTVLATNITTGCTSTEQITIEENLPEIPVPDVQVVSHQTSCVTSNGEISASVNGNTSNYIFTWYSGQDVSGTPIYTGDLLTGQAPGFYTVTATEISTGCVSGGVVAEIIEDLEYPDFVFEVENADCNENNGSIKLNLSDQVIVQSIVWNTPSGVVFGPNLIGYPVGDYEVTVTTSLGCTTTKSVSILSNITPYNGISFNGDGMNDFFQVSCLELYPNNNVKIFNRAGTLVYETDGYNNADNIFEGVANKGISVLGSKLPSGTYFYVIDKRNNTKAVSGYLELLND